MKKLFVILIAIFCISHPQVNAAVPQPEPIAREEMANNLIGIQNLFYTMYAPAEWKKEHLGWDLREAVQTAIGKIYSHPNIALKDYQEILVEFFSSMRDYHVGIHFHSTESAMLPFRVRGAEGRYFVAWVDNSAPADFPLHVGDEILTFDGEPIHEAVESLIQLEKRDLINETDRELAAIFLTMRTGQLGHRVPQGTATITAQPLGSRIIHTYALAWDYHQELIKGLPGSGLANREEKELVAPKSIYEAAKHFNSHTNMSSPMIKVAKSIKAEGGFPVGDARGPLPLLGEPVWIPRGNNYFFSYIFLSDAGKKIGYIRIPHFMGPEDPDQDDIADLRKIIKVFQRKTDALVIDLVDNSGGELFTLLSYLSVLTKEPLPFVKQRVSLTQEDVVESLDWLEKIDSFLEVSVDPEEITFLGHIRQYFTFLCDEWNAGHFLSDPTYLLGIDKIVPDEEAHYDKPMLVLVNGLDFSCADLFPAILQDAKRAAIFGSKTAGAGGAVNVHLYPNRSGIHAYTYTATIIERDDRQPLENLGVTPDIPYSVTPDDLQNGYQGYINAVHRALKPMVK